MLETLSQQGRAGLWVVVGHSGRTPGKTGFKMALAPDGRRYGTIGGGVMEHRLLAAESSGQGAQLLRQVHHKQARPEEQSGMICAGQQQIAILSLTKEDVPNIVQLVAAERGENACLLKLNPDGLHVGADEEALGLVQEGENWQYCERLPSRPLVHVVGGGHVGVALCRLLTQLAYRVWVYDHRVNLDTMQGPPVWERALIGDYDQLELTAQTPGAYAAVVSTSAQTDIQALSHLLGKPLGYIGLMGSPAKINHIRESLLAADHSLQDWLKVTAPIGLPIGAATPAEIAVSIAAEMIQKQRQ